MQEGKYVSDSRVSLSRMMGPQDTNGHGNVHGGVIMKQVDEAGALASMRHAQAPTVTVAVDSMTFMHPIYVGNVVQFNAELTYAGRTSMEVRVEVISENPITGEAKLTNTAYVVYVALDSSGRPQTVPPLICQTDEEKHRAEQAKERQEFRRKQRREEKSGSISHE